MTIRSFLSRCERFSFARNETPDKGRITQPSQNNKWPMMKWKHRNDECTGRADYYWKKAEIEANTARIVTNEQGIKCLRFPNDRPVIVKNQKYVILDDPDFKENNGERLVIGSRFAFHSTIAGGQDIKYGGYITTNNNSRLSKASDVDSCTGHYFQAYSKEAHTLEEKQQAQDWDQYRNQKFSELIDEEIEIGDNSTVGLGLEPQEQRIAAEFPNG